MGIDISAQQIANNTVIDEGIVGDVQTHPISDTFDLIVTWDLLEHLADPIAALDNLARAVKPGGVLVIGIPNVASVKGLVTKFTPHRFHVWFFREVRKSPRAGGAEGPFPTYLRWSLRGPSLRSWAATRGFTVELVVAYESEIQASLRQRYGVVDRRWTLLKAVLRGMTLGQVSAGDSDLAIVLKSAARAPQPGRLDT